MFLNQVANLHMKGDMIFQTFCVPLSKLGPVVEIRTFDGTYILHYQYSTGTYLGTVVGTIGTLLILVHTCTNTIPIPVVNWKF